jgi:peptide deformylase
MRIAQLGQPVLRMPAREVPLDEIGSESFRKFLADLRATLTESGGVGLAAPQVFDSRRVFLAAVLPPGQKGSPPGVEAFINPRFVEMSEEKVNGWEGCLSFSELVVKVPRSKHVILDYVDETGQAKRIDLDGWLARIVQHEFDHLEGVLTIDRAATTRDIIKASELDDVLDLEGDTEDDEDDEDD